MTDFRFIKVYGTMEKVIPQLDVMLEELFALHRFGIKPGLKRTLELCRLCGHPERRLKVIHVAGTNGKGTVCSVLAAAYSAAGYRVGLYTSPHIHRFNERLRIDGQEITDTELLAYCHRLMPFIREAGATFFEATTVLAFLWFAEQNIEIAIIETGLGGRFDATNILPTTSVLQSIITSIDLDHEEYLGTNLEVICREKAGIIKTGVPVLIAEQRPELRTIVQEVADAVAAPLTVVNNTEEILRVRYIPDCTMQIALPPAPPLELPDLWWRVKLCGEHQARNIATAYKAVQQLQEQFPVHDEQFFAGLTDLQRYSGLHARITCLRAEPPLIIDVGHNPAGLIALRNTLDKCGYTGIQWTCIFTAMMDKNIQQMLEILAPVVDTMFVPPLTIPRAAEPEFVAGLARQCGIQAAAVPDVATACDRVVVVNKPTFIVGSFYLIDEALPYLRSIGLAEPV